MTTSQTTTAADAPMLDVPLQHRFADALPELALPWRADDAPEPRLLAVSEDVAADLGLDPDVLRSEAGVGLLTGTALPPGAKPVAQGYAGHQFGGYSPRLGDGRALLLGELADRRGRWRDVHLKGSGRTPFSRGGDGFAAVGPMLREYVVSEAMHALGIPTTRSLAVVATGRAIRRETMLPGAVLARVASSHLRVGTFQYARALGDQAGSQGLLRRLADHAIERHHPEVAEADAPHVALYDAVVAAQADLVASWMVVGFVHGVMNTDNMTISGETIDYGPCAFVDAHDRATVFSSIDEGGRYAFGNQPSAASWDLARLAEAMLPLFADDQDEAVAIATGSLQQFAGRYANAWTTGMSAKLGLSSADTDAAVVRPLLEDLDALMQASRVDHTSFFRSLARLVRGDAEPARGVLLDLPAFDAWTGRWLALHPDADAMDTVNPVYVPRNHLVESALDAATAGDMGPVERLVEVIRRPYDERTGLEEYAAPAPDHLGAYVTYCGT